MTAQITVAVCGLPVLAANRITAWFTQHDALGLQAAMAVDSTERLLAGLAAHPAHCVVIDAGLGLEGLSFAQELLAAGYTAVCLAGAADRPQVRQRASDLGLACCPDYEPGRLAAVLRGLLGLTEGAAADSQVITFHSPRGGAGTSTLLLHIAQVLQGRGRNVVVVEVGGCGSTVPLLGLRPEGGWGELPLGADLAADPDAAAIITRALVEIKPGLCLLPSSGPAIMDQVGADLVEAVLQLLPACGFSYILVDAGSEMSLPTATALAAAHTVCLVCLPDPVSAFRLVQTQEVLSGLQVETARIHPVINRCRESIPQRLTEVLEFLLYRPALRVPEESRPPVDASGRFTGFRPGSGAAKALDGLLERLALEVSHP